MKAIMAPWRMAYIMGKKAEGCIFCQDSIRDEGLVLHEGTRAFITMNRYPYTNGHLLVAPYRHVADFEDLDNEEGSEIFDLAALFGQGAQKGDETRWIQYRDKHRQGRRGRGSVTMCTSTWCRDGRETRIS